MSPIVLVRKRSGDINLLLDTHFPGKSLIEPLTETPVAIRTTGITGELFTEFRLTPALESFRPFKSSGPDVVSSAELQVVANRIIPWLEKLYTGISYIPIKPSIRDQKTFGPLV